MLAALTRRVGGWIGRLFGRRERRIAAQHSATGGRTGVTQRTDDRVVLPVRGGSDEPEIRVRRRAASDRSARPEDRPRVAPEAAVVDDATAVGEGSATAPVEPEAVEGTDEPLREATRRSLVPRWLAAIRTQTFTGLAGIGLMIFGGLTFLVSGGLTADADLIATQAVQGIAAPWFGPLMLAVSAFGFFPQSFIMIAVIAALFWRAGYRTESGFALAAAASVVITEVIKSFVGRPRPAADLVTVVPGVGGHSFPSGHTLFYVTFFGFLAYLAYAQLKPGRLRTAVIWLTGILILLVGPSRIWMGHHWASDVLASYALGLTYLVVLVQWYGRRRLGLASTAAGAPATAQ